MLRDKMDSLENMPAFKGVITVQMFNEQGELVSEVERKNAINTKMANYYYGNIAQTCIVGYENARPDALGGSSIWTTLRLSQSKYLDSLNPAECLTYRSLAYADLYNSYAGSDTTRGTINKNETFTDKYSGVMGRRNYIPYINFVCDFPTHSANVTFDTIMITGNNPQSVEHSSYSQFYFNTYSSKGVVIHNDRGYSIRGNRLMSAPSRWDMYKEVGRYTITELFPSDVNKNNYAYHAFYNSRLYVFSNNISTGQLDILEVIGYDAPSPKVTTMKTNLETDPEYADICDVAIREGKIFILRGKNNTNNMRLTVFNLTNYAKIHTHDFTSYAYDVTDTKQYRSEAWQRGSACYHLKDRIRFYVACNYNSSYTYATRIDILLKDYSHVDWGDHSISTTSYSSRGYHCRFSNAYGVFLSSTGDTSVTSDFNFRYTNPCKFTGISHIVKLDSPITKTETNTMKIQYRVEFENTIEHSVFYAEELGNVWN